MTGEEASGRRLSELLLGVSAVLTVLVIGLAAGVVLLLRAEPRLEQLDADTRMRLVEEVRRLTPPLFETFPGLVSPGFYRFAPARRYDGSDPLAGTLGVFRDHFTTNELGFRAIPVAKPSGVRRIVVVGDSWVFAPGVSHEASFGQQLTKLLNGGSSTGTWQVFNLGMMGWNTENQLTALRVLRPWLDPDYVIFCVTSNDIDDAFRVWNGALSQGAFQAGGIFRRSYEVERRWVQVLRDLDAEAQRLALEGIPNFLYFLAEWRKLAPFYAGKAAVRTPYAVVPEPFILDPYLLSVEQDPGRHPNAEGHRRIARYLHDVVAGLGWVGERERLEPEFPLPLPAPALDTGAVAAEFEFWKPFAIAPGPIEREEGRVGHETVLVVANRPGSRRLELDVELLAAPSLYPLQVEAGVLGPGVEPTRFTFEHYVGGVRRLELPIPAALDSFEFLELRVTADRSVSLPPRVLPQALRIAALRVAPPP